MRFVFTVIAIILMLVVSVIAILAVGFAIELATGLS